MMLDQLLSAAKSALRPLARHRALIERAKYSSVQILGPQAGNDRLSRLLSESASIAVGKIGESELGGLRHYERYKNAEGRCTRWGAYWRRLHVNAGIYPADAVIFSNFCRVFSDALGNLNILAVWFQHGENNIRLKFAPNATPVALTALEPFYHDRPWSQNLTGKRVLIVTPFASTVVSQYARRTDIWPDKPDILPEFHIDTLRCPLSAGVTTPAFPDWFAALDAMKAEMNTRLFDIAIIGAGAWGVPLASHAKEMGKIGIHLGGPTQLLFGIRGGRWDRHPIIQHFFNSAWVRPSVADRPENFRSIENGCYW
jgi:hypothetical protein